MWRAACLAIDQANQTGGYRGAPFRLVAGWAENPWGSGVTQITRMVYVHNVWAIIGGIDGPSTHLAEQVAAKARLTLLSPVCTDRTANLANVPWMFSCLPQDHLQAPVLAEAIAQTVNGLTVRRLDGLTVRRLDGLTVRRLDGWTVRRLDGWTV
jgi:ABC-type branched-subunit amino acid transport system substrate-binding protein